MDDNRVDIMKSRFRAFIMGFAIVLLLPNPALPCMVDVVNDFGFYLHDKDKMRKPSTRVELFGEIHSYFRALYEKIPITETETKEILDELHWFERQQRTDFQIMEAKHNLEQLEIIFWQLKVFTEEIQELKNYRLVDATHENALLNEAIKNLTSVELSNSLNEMAKIGLVEQPDNMGFHFGCSLLAHQLSSMNYDRAWEIYFQLQAEQDDRTSNKQLRY